MTVRRAVCIVAILLVCPAQAEAKAKLQPEQRYGRIARKVGARYGLATPPAATFGKIPVKPPGWTGPVNAVTTYGEDATPTIHFGRAVSKRLVSRDPVTRRKSRRVVLWELGRAAHPPQDEADARFGTPWLKRQTNKVSHQLNKQQARAQAMRKRLNP